MEIGEVENLSKFNYTGENDTTSPTPPEIFYFARNFTFYSLAVIIPLGVLCNILGFMTLLTAHFRRHSSSWYLSALAIADTVVLVTEFIRKWLPNHRVGLNWYHTSTGVCLPVTYFSLSFRFISAWLILLFTIERTFSILYPLKARLVFANTSKAKYIIALVHLVGCVIGCYMFPFVTIYEDRTISFCGMDPHKSALRRTYNYVTLGYLCLACYLPALLIFGLNIVITTKYCQQRKQNDKMYARSTRKRSSNSRLVDNGRFTVIINRAVKNIIVCVFEVQHK